MWGQEDIWHDKKTIMYLYQNPVEAEPFWYN